MPLPIPFYLRNSQTSPLTHAQLDGNLSILSTKIDNTTCNNMGGGVGIFKSKQINANDGIMNLYSLSGSNGINVGISGNTLVISGGAVDSDWVTNGNNIYNGNTGNVGIGAIPPGVPIVSAKLHINNTTTEPSFLVEDSAHPDSTPFIISSGGSVSIGTDIISSNKKLLISGDTLSEGDIYLPDNHTLRIGDISDLQIYHDGSDSRISEVGTGNLLISGTEVWISDGITGKSFLRTYSTEGKVELQWSGETRTTTGEDGLILNKTISGTPVANLSVRADGTIITGSTVPVGPSINVDASTDPNVFGYNIVDYTATLPGGTIYLGDSALLPTGFTVKLIRTSSTSAASLGAAGTSVINGSATKALPTTVYSEVVCTANGNDWFCVTNTPL